MEYHLLARLTETAAIALVTDEDLYLYCYKAKQKTLPWLYVTLPYHCEK